MAKKQPPTARGAAPKTTRRPSLTARISPGDRVALYAAARYLPSSLERACGLQIPFTTYMQDPAVAKDIPALAFNEELFVDWEPGLADGPTSARFAVVDYNADTGELTPPAEWDEKLQKFVIGNKVVEQKTADLPQFHQVSVWATLQRALAFFEDGSALGRRIPWGFEGNRLIVVPRAGYGENAYYDRSTKSLQFYYFGWVWLFWNGRFVGRANLVRGELLKHQAALEVKGEGRHGWGGHRLQAANATNGLQSALNGWSSSLRLYDLMSRSFRSGLRICGFRVAGTLGGE